MRLIPLSEIKINENRQRREFEAQALQDLADSIEKFGLFHPIIVREGEVLVAGERRLRAIAQIFDLGGSFHFSGELVPRGSVPTCDLGSLSPLEAEEAELDENTKRKDLTWQEHAAAVARLHALRSAQAEARGEKQTLADTAREVTGVANNYRTTETAQKIQIAAHLDNPVVAGAKTIKEAIKLLSREEDRARNVALARDVGETYSSKHLTLLNRDCVEWMLTDAPQEQFDVILTDPPYGMGADSFGDAAGRLTTITHGYSDSQPHFRKLLEGAARGIDRIAKPAAHLYLCCDIDQFHWLKSLFEGIGGWYVTRTPLINVKLSGGRVPHPEHGPRRAWECILYAFRGEKRVTAIYPDVINTAGDDNLGHGAQKPVALYVDLLRRSARPGDWVCDPFAGTGTILSAAYSLQLRAVAVEMDPASYGIALGRLKGLDPE